MYLILMNSQLLGYTYDELAVKTLILVNKRSGDLPLLIKKVPDNYPACGVKTKKHIENLVNWYKNNGYEKFLWKYIVYNRDIVPKFSWRFIEEFHDTMMELQIDDLYSDLNKAIYE